MLSSQMPIPTVAIYRVLWRLSPALMAKAFYSRSSSPTCPAKAVLSVCEALRLTLHPNSQLTKTKVYHLHDQPVSPDGNCSATLAHLDPYERGEATPCDITRPETCQVGDLSGKHGDINSNPWNATYTDYYASTLPGIGAFFGNRSLVIHFKNVTRITCANFTAVGTGSSGAPATMRPNTSTTSPTSFTTGMATPTSLSPVGSNTTGTGARPTTTFVTAAAATNVPAAILGIGAAVLAFAL